MLKTYRNVINESTTEKNWFQLPKNRKKCDLGGEQGPLVTPAILGHVCTATQSAVVLDRADHRSGVVVNKNTTNTQLVSALVSLLCNSRDAHWLASPENITKTCRTWTRCERLHQIVCAVCRWRLRIKLELLMSWSDLMSLVWGNRRQFRASCRQTVENPGGVRESGLVGQGMFGALTLFLK